MSEVGNTASYSAILRVKNKFRENSPSAIILGYKLVYDFWFDQHNKDIV